MKISIKRIILSLIILINVNDPQHSFSHGMDSLWAVWNDQTKPDSLRLDAIHSILYTSHFQIPIEIDSFQRFSQEMYDLAVAAGNKKSQAQALLLLGKASRHSYSYEKARVYYEKCLSICKEIDYLKGIGEIYQSIGSMLEDEASYKEALINNHKALQQFKEIHDTLAMAYCLNTIGSNYKELSEYKMARRYYEMSLGLVDSTNEALLYYSVNGNIAAILADQGDFNRALPQQVKCLNHFSAIGYSEGVGIASEVIGNIYNNQGHHDLALEWYEKALTVFQENNSKLGIAWVLGSIGEAYKKKGSYILALDYLNRSMIAYNEINYKLGVADCLIAYGQFYSDLGNYDQSLEYLQNGIALQEEIGNNAGIARAYAILGEIYQKLADYSQSLRYYELSLSIFEEQERRSDIAEVYNKLGNYYSENNDHDKALDFLKQSEWIFHEIGHLKGMSEASLDIGKIYLTIGQPVVAMKWFEKGYDIIMQTGALSLELKASDMLYHAYRVLGQDEKALYFLEHSLALKDSLKTGDAQLQLQLMEFEQQRRADSLAMEEESLKKELAYEKTLGHERRVRYGLLFSGLVLLLLAGAIFSRMLYIRRTKKELERKNVQIAEAKDRAEASEKAKEEFFNNVSHEFRTPLTLILGPLQEAIETTTDERLRPGLEIMERNALRLQEMINELLDLSKLEFGKMKLRAREENIVWLTEEYLHSFESLADQRNIRLKFKSDAKLLHAWVDVEKYRKILSNLLSNAFRYTSPGGRIVVSVGSSTSGYVDISVSDTGKGIAPGHLPHIFDRFYRVDEATGTGLTGTGIGLALTKELVELHHGRIEVNSQEGKGTTFTVRIPMGKEHLAREEMMEDVPLKAGVNTPVWEIEKDISGPVSEDDLRNRKDTPIVLVVEDNQDMRSYIKNHLEKDYRVLEAGEGQAGFQAAVEHIPDLVVSDVMMPGMDGFVMTEKLKDDPRTSHIPVILLTARASVENRIEGLVTGADAYVTKPFDFRELKVRVSMLINQRQQLREHFRKIFESPDRYLAKDPQLASMDQQFVQKAIDVMEQHLEDEHFNAGNFAKEMALSRVQLHRKIRALTGKSTTEFIRTIRLNKASVLLRNKTGTVTEIAYQVGFSSLSYFTTSFTEQFSMTPSDFMRKYNDPELKQDT